MVSVKMIFCEMLKDLLLDKAKSKESKPPKEARNFSVSRHEQKQRKRRRRKKSTGRKPKDAKRDLTTDTIDRSLPNTSFVGLIFYGKQLRCPFVIRKTANIRDS